MPLENIDSKNTGRVAREQAVVTLVSRGLFLMLIVMRAQATEQDIAQVCARIQSLGFRAHVMPGAERTAVGITGNHGPVPAEEFESLAGVAEAIPVSKPYKLVSREVKPDNTVVDVAGVLGGGSELAMCAGPCSVESREQILEAARAVKAAGAQLACAAARTSRELRLTRFKAWAKRGFDT